MAHEKILIIKLGALGDVMMNTGLIRARSSGGIRARSSR